MTDTATPRFALPLLATGQAQKEMSHNEAIALIDLILHPRAEALGSETPPAEPEPGQCWVLGPDPSGDWSGHAGEVAGWSDGGWRFVTPFEGLRLWIGRSEGFACFTGGEWVSGEAHGRLIVEGQQVVGARLDAIVEPDGGTVVDAEARAAISAVLLAMRAHGLVATS